MNFRYAAGRRDGMTEEKLSQVHDLDSPVFTDRERAAMRFATAMARNETDDAPELFAEMRRFFDDAQLVEIGFVVTTLHGMNQFNNMFGIEPEDQPMESLTGMPASDAAD
jgi:alkylhydroperoxidase family enzyme